MELLKKENARMKKSYFTYVLTVLMVALMSVGFVACGDDDDAQDANKERAYAGVDGIWIGTYYKYSDDEDSGEQYFPEDGEFGMAIDFNSNGTYKWVIWGADGDKEVLNGNWKREKNVLKLTVHGEAFNLSIHRWDDDILVFSIIDDGEYNEYHFRKATQDDKDLLTHLK